MSDVTPSADVLPKTQLQWVPQASVRLGPHLWGEQAAPRPGARLLHGSHGAGNAHARTHMHTRRMGQRTWQLGPQRKRRGSWRRRIPVGRWSPSEEGPDDVRLGPGDLQR